MVKTSVKKNLYYEIKDKVIEEAFDGVRVNKRKARVRVYGLDSTKAVRADLIDLLYERVRYHKDKFISPMIYNELETMQVKPRSGKVEHSDGAHDDQVFSYLMALYVLYNGSNLMENWGIQRNAIKTDEDKEIEESMLESEIEHKEKLDTSAFLDHQEEGETVEEQRTREFFEKNSLIKTSDKLLAEMEAEDKKSFENLLAYDMNARGAYNKYYHTTYDTIYGATGLTNIPDYAFEMFNMDEEEQRQQIQKRNGNLYSLFTQL